MAMHADDQPLGGGYSGAGYGGGGSGYGELEGGDGRRDIDRGRPRGGGGGYSDRGGPRHGGGGGGRGGRGGGRGGGGGGGGYSDRGRGRGGGPGRGAGSRHGSDAGTGPPEARTLYFGNLPEDVPVQDVLDFVYGGPLESFHFVSGKACAFVTFLSAGAASEFYRRAMDDEPMELDGRQIKLGWGKETTMSHEVEDLLRDRATRTIFLKGVKNWNSKSLQEEFNKYGVLDRVDVVAHKDIAFVHFCRITAAGKAMRALMHSSEWKGGLMNYAPDRCATPTPQRRRGKSAHANRRGPPGVEGPKDLASPVLWIGGLDGAVSLDDIRGVVSKFGNVREVKFAAARKRAALVTYGTPEEAAHGAKMLAGETIKGQDVVAVATKVSKNLWIGNLEGVAEDKLTECFAAHGKIQSVRVLAKTKCAFVNFQTEQDALTAFQALNLTSLGGGLDMSISFQYAKPKPKPPQRRPQNGGGGFGRGRSRSPPPKRARYGGGPPMYDGPRGPPRGDYGGRPFRDSRDMPPARPLPPIQDMRDRGPIGPVPPPHSFDSRSRDQTSFDPRSRDQTSFDPRARSQAPLPRGYAQAGHGLPPAQPKKRDAELLGEAVRSCAICRVSLHTVEDFYQHYLGAAHTLEADELMNSGYKGEALDEHRVVLAALRGPKAELQAYLRAELQPGVSAMAR